MHLNSLRNNKYWNELPQKNREKIKNKFKETKSEIGVADFEGLKTIIERITVEPFLFYTTLYFACQMWICYHVYYDKKIEMYGCPGNMFDEMINFCFYANYYLTDLTKIDWDRKDWLCGDDNSLDIAFINALDKYNKENIERKNILETYLREWEG